MDKTKKPLWIQHVEDTVSKPSGYDYLKNTGSTLPLRYNGNATQDGESSMFRRHEGMTRQEQEVDTTSLISHSSYSSRSETHAARRLGLVLILIVIAFIIAIGIGCLVYFLLLSEPPGGLRSITVADSTVRVLNETYKDAMADNSSMEFKRIAEPFCAEISSYFRKTNYGSRFNDCRVMAIRDVALGADCVCFTSGKGFIEVAYQLFFLGSHGDNLKVLIPDVLEKHSKKVLIGDAVHVLIKYFLVDVRVAWNVPYNAIQSELTLQVYNLTYSEKLKYHNSSTFLRHAVPFCADIDEFLQNSYLGYRYYDCEVTKFGNRPTTVSVALRFTGKEPRPIQTGLIYIIMQAARNHTVDGKLLKIIGNLLVTPYDPTFTLAPTNITGQPTTTSSPTTVTPSAPWGNAVYVTTPLLVYNLTFNKDLADPNTIDFIKLARPFCKDLERMYIIYSQYKDRYYSCEVKTFKDKPVSVVFTLVFRGRERSGLEDSVIRVIKTGAPKNVFDNKVVYLVGNTWVILGEDGQSIGPTSLPVMHSTAIVPPSVTSVYLYYNGLRLDTYLRVYNLTYTHALADPSSRQFQHQAEDFCKDLRKFYSYSEYAERYFDCELKTISPDPIFFFHLLFWGRDQAGIKNSLTTVIKRYAKRVPVDGRWMYRVGNVLVLPEDMFVTVIPTNITMTETSTMMSTVTSTIQMTSAVSSSVYVIPPFYDTTIANITYPLYKFSYADELKDPSSPLFRHLLWKFCRDIASFYKSSFLFLIYQNCDIHSFSNHPNRITFKLYFYVEMSEPLKQNIIHVLDTKAPKHNFTDGNQRVETLHVGDLHLIRNNWSIELIPANWTQTLTPVVETTNVIDFSTDIGFSTDVTMSSVIDVYIKTNVTLEYRLYRFHYDPSLSSSDSAKFKDYELILCKELAAIYSRAAVLNTLYDGCQVNWFRDGPNSIRFHVVFKTRDSTALSDIVKRTLESSRPHFNATESQYVIYEVMPVGGLVFILRNLTFIPGTTVSPSTTEMTSPSMTTTPVPTIQANVTLEYPLYRFHYDPSLSNSDSEKFNSYRSTLCRELAAIYTRAPVLNTLYHGCQIDWFREGPNSIRFHVVFNTRESAALSDLVKRTLESSRPHFNATESQYVIYEVMPVGGLVFILRNLTVTPPVTTVSPSSTEQVTSPSITTTPVPTIQANVTLEYPLYRFHYDPSLSNSDSEKFNNYRSTLCRELAAIYTGAPVLNTLYHGCQIDWFREGPNSIRFHVVFNTRESAALSDLVKRTLESSRPHFNATESQYVIYEVMPVGGLVFILRNLTVTPPVTTVSPSSTEQVTSPSITTTPVPTIKTNVTLEYLLYRFHYDPSLSNSDSEKFNNYNLILCRELAAIYTRADVLDTLYNGCQIDWFREGPNSIRFHVVFNTRESAALSDLVKRTLESSRPHFNATESQYVIYEVMPVGGLVFILRNLTVTPPVTTVSPSSTEQVTSPSTTTTPLPINWMKAHFSWWILGFTFLPELNDRNSTIFKIYQNKFCSDIKRFYMNSYLGMAYRNCEIIKFNKGPPKDTIAFEISFDTPLYPQLLGNIVNVLLTEAPRLNISYHTILDVGDIHLILHKFNATLVDPVASTTRVWIPSSKYVTTVRSTLSIIPTSSEEATSTAVIGPSQDWILAIFNYGLLNFRYYPELSDRDSMLFQIYERKFCNDIESFYRQSYLAAAYAGCTIKNFSTDSSEITFHVKFKPPYFSKMQKYILTILESVAPKLNISSFTVLDVGDIYLIWKNFTFKIVNPDPSITTIWWVEPTTTIIEPTSTAEPEMTSSLIETTTPEPPKRWVRAIFDYRLLNFRHYPELDDKDSLLFKIYQRKFCDDIASFYKNSFLYAAYRECNIADFSSSGDKDQNITFHISFDTPVFPRLQSYILRVLETQAPKLDISTYKVMDVGDLYLIWKNFTYKIVTPEPLITTRWWSPSTTVIATSTEVVMETSTVEMTSSIVVTTPDPRIFWLQAMFEYGLLNFRHYPELSNRSSTLFQIYQRKFCDAIQSFYRNSFLYAAYRKCEIKNFGRNPNTIDFRIYFETPMFPKLQSYIISVLETQAPKLNISTHTVMDVGDLYLIWKNFTFKVVTPEPEITTMIWTEPSTTMTTSIEPSTTEIEATSTMVTTTEPPQTDWVLAIFNYSLFDFTYLPELKDKSSVLFKLYERKFCEDIAHFYDKTYLGVAYKDCKIREFGDDETINFHIAFHTPLFPTLQADILKFLETNSPKLNISRFTVMDVGDLYLIWRNFTYFIVCPEPQITTIHWVMPTTTLVSSSIEPSTSSLVIETSTVPTTTINPEFEWVLAIFKFNLLNFDFYPELKDRDSLLFEIYERKFCSDIYKFYQKDYLSYAYRGCKIQEFGKDTIKFYIAFQTPIFPTLMADVINVLDTRAPKLNISRYEVLDIGDLFLIWDNFTLILVPPRVMSTTLTWTPVSSTVVSSIAPTSTSVVIPSSSALSRIDEWVLAIFKFGLLEFNYYPTLADKDSPLFQMYQRRFCEDIAKYYSVSYLSEAYRDCQITEFNEQPDAVKFFIAFETPIFSELQGDILNILESGAPKYNISNHTVLNVGDLFLIWSNFTYIIVLPKKLSSTATWTPSTSSSFVMPSVEVTSPTPTPTTTEFVYEIQLSFEVLNIPYSPDLMNQNSFKFKRHQQLSCDDISELLLSMPKKYAGYQGCRVDKYLPNPLRVYFSLVFSDQQAEETSARVQALMVEVADRENFYDMVALQLGDLVIAVDNFTVSIHHNGTINPKVTTPTIMYDAILYNYTFYMYYRNFTDALKDPSSQTYKRVSEKFCRDIKKYYMASYLNERYFSCDVKSFGNRQNPYMNVHVVFNGTYDYGSSLVFDVVNVSAPAFYAGGIRMIRLGDLLVYAKDAGMSILIQWSDVTTAAPPVTEFPVLYTQFDVSIEILNLTYSWDLSDRKSERFRKLASEFCQQMDTIFSTKLPDYFGCVVQEFRFSPMSIVFSLRFRGIQDGKMEKLVNGLLYDNGWRFDTGTVEFAYGQLKMDPASIHIRTSTIRDGEIVSQVTPGITTPIIVTPSTTPAEANPCFPNKNGFVRHPTECDSFYVCSNGRSADKMKCGHGQIFNRFMCGPRPPGFICRPRI